MLLQQLRRTRSRPKGPTPLPPPSPPPPSPRSLVSPTVDQNRSRQSQQRQRPLQQHDLQSILIADLCDISSLPLSLCHRTRYARDEDPYIHPGFPSFSLPTTIPRFALCKSLMYHTTTTTTLLPSINLRTLRAEELYPLCSCISQLTCDFLSVVSSPNRLSCLSWLARRVPLRFLQQEEADEVGPKQCLRWHATRTRERRQDNDGEIKKGLQDRERGSASTPSRPDRPQPAQASQREYPPLASQEQAKPRYRSRRRA